MRKKLLNQARQVADTVMREQMKEERFRIALGHLEEQLLIQPRTESGNYWHKQIYPNQIWLDGLFMGQPFRAQYARVFGREDWYDDILGQFVMAEAKTYETRCGLYAHACDESRSAFWADPRTGRSFRWLRCMRKRIHHIFQQKSMVA